MWPVVLKIPKLLCLLFLICISSVYATPFAKKSTIRTTLSPTAITSTGMFVPLLSVFNFCSSRCWFLRIVILGDWDCVKSFCQISKNTPVSFVASSQYMVIGGARYIKQTEVIDLTDSSLTCTFRQWLECFLKNPSEEVGHFFLTRLFNCWQISGRGTYT